MICQYCELPMSGKKAYDCPLYDCRMYPHFCLKVMSQPAWKRMHDEGRGPTQNRPAVEFTPVQDPEKRKQRCPDCKGDLPPLAKMMWSLGKALAAYVADGLHNVDAAEYERRLKICDGCDRRIGKKQIDVPSAVATSPSRRAVGRGTVRLENGNGYRLTPAVGCRITCEIVDSRLPHSSHVQRSRSIHIATHIGSHNPTVKADARMCRT